MNDLQLRPAQEKILEYENGRLESVLESVPMSNSIKLLNDSEFDFTVPDPLFSPESGPRILLDAAHHNFFVQHNFMQPFIQLVNADGYQVDINTSEFTGHHLAQFDILVIITALPFESGTKKEATDPVFTTSELDTIYSWVENGGSLLVFSEHAPFDQAINPLLNKFDIHSSIGAVVDPFHADKNLTRPGWIVFSRENGLLNCDHPITNGRNSSERIDKVITFRGSSLTGSGYTNLFHLAETAENIPGNEGVGPIGMGNSQALLGSVGLGKIVAFGDANGFTAMAAQVGDELILSGMSLPGYDWKQFVLNTLHWLSGELS